MSCFLLIAPSEDNHHGTPQNFRCKTNGTTKEEATITANQILTNQIQLTLPIGTPEQFKELAKYTVLFLWQENCISYAGKKYLPGNEYLPEYGNSAHGRVTRYLSPESNYSFAVKTPKAQTISLTDWHREVKFWNIAHPVHPAFIAVNDAKTTARLIMPDFGSVSLAKAFESATDEISFRISLSLIEAIQHLHKNGITHNDLQSDNIRVVNQYQVKLIDFGISSPLTKIGRENDLGSISYHISNKSSIYKLISLSKPGYLKSTKWNFNFWRGQEESDEYPDTAFKHMQAVLEYGLAKETKSKEEARFLINKVLNTPNLNVLDPDLFAQASKMQTELVSETTSTVIVNNAVTNAKTTFTPKLSSTTNNGFFSGSSLSAAAEVTVVSTTTETAQTSHHMTKNSIK